MNKSTVLVALYICGDNFDLQSVSNRLNITPTGQYKKGDRSPITNKIREYTEWWYEIGYEESCDISVQTKKLLDIFSNKINELLRLEKEENIEIYIDMCTYGKDDMRAPIIFDKEFIAFAHVCNAIFISMDWYISR